MKDFQIQAIGLMSGTSLDGPGRYVVALSGSKPENGLST